PGASGPADARREAGRRWEALLSEIRSRPGLGDFWAVPTIDRLRRQARDGHVVLVMAGREGGSALILADDPAEPVRHLPLPGLGSDKAREQVLHLRRALRGTARPASAGAGTAPHGTSVNDVLGWLWDAVAGPVLAAAGHTAAPEPGRAWPRIWWCPVGVVAGLPLHAAGHHPGLTPESDDPDTVLDRVVSSYTPTIRALGYAREAPAATEHAGERPAADNALIVAVPAAPGTAPLPGVETEVRLLRPLLPDAFVLTGPQAVRDIVLTALPRCAVAHFACHGVSDWADPETGRLILHDHETKPLTLGRVSGLDLAEAELVYLSACSTGDAIPRLADEAVHMTGAFQLAGYRNVVGTLWPISDRAASSIAAGFYERLTDGGRRPADVDGAAHALHESVRAYRAVNPSPARWAAHVHVGP
ncbi:CHAT domain-containing protein, partial [Actinospica durhamensis]